MNPTFLGTGSRMLNGYALVNSEGVYTGQREAAPNQRVFILTRSGFAGQQRYSAVTWSGDITSTWTAMAKQIPAGLGASISGLPYWTMDTGGYTMQRKFSQEPMTPGESGRMARAECPLVRVLHLHSHPARARRVAAARDVDVRRRLAGIQRRAEIRPPPLRLVPLYLFPGRLDARRTTTP